MDCIEVNREYNLNKKKEKKVKIINNDGDCIEVNREYNLLVMEYNICAL